MMKALRATRSMVKSVRVAACEAVGFAPEEASYFLGNEVPVPSLQPELPRWQEQIFAFLTRNAVRAPDYFLIPPPRVVELGTRVEL
jgi:KUP system potassium uptake protein